MNRAVVQNIRFSFLSRAESDDTGSLELHDLLPDERRLESANTKC